MKSNALCECGCGERVRRTGNRFVNGHNRRGQKLSDKHRRNISERQKGGDNHFYGKTHSAEARHKISRALTGRPSPLRGKKCSPEHRRKISNAAKRRAGEKAPGWRGGPVEALCEHCGRSVLRRRSSWLRSHHHFCSPECRGLYFSGERHENWRGGKGPGRYAPGFNDALRRLIRERNAFVCQLCGAKENGRRHSCHHIDYDKMNNELGNFTLLCNYCHRKTNDNRSFWANLFQARVKLEKCTGPWPQLEKP